MSSVPLKPSSVLPAKYRALSIEKTAVRWYHVPAITSTMDIAAGHARDGGMPWTAISADNQTKGRGTHGRDWYSPGGQGFWVSILLPLPERIEYADGYTLKAAQALADTLREHAGLECAIKHPNDVMAGGRKLAGILIESVSRGEEPVSLVLGMGINLGQTEAEFLTAGLPEATSLRMETGVMPDREQLLSTFIAIFMVLIRDVSVPKGVIPGVRGDTC